MKFCLEIPAFFFCTQQKNLHFIYRVGMVSWLKTGWYSFLFFTETVFFLFFLGTMEEITVISDY